MMGWLTVKIEQIKLQLSHYFSPLWQQITAERTYRRVFNHLARTDGSIGIGERRGLH